MIVPYDFTGQPMISSATAMAPAPAWMSAAAPMARPASGGWASTGGEEPAPTVPDPTPPAAPGPTTPDLFQPNLYPFSISGSNSNQSSRSRQFSGLPGGYPEQLLSSIIPQLLEQVGGMQGAVDRYVETAPDLYRRQGEQLMRKQLPQLLSRLAGRGTLNSSIASDAIGRMGFEIADQVGNQSLQAMLNATQMQLNIPAIMGQLAHLGQVSMGDSSSSGSSSSSGYSANPLAPYQLLLDFVNGGYLPVT